MIRILYITDSLIAGGVESQLVELVTRLDRNRFEPHVAYLYGARAGIAPHFAPALAAAGVPLYPFDLDWSAASKVSAVWRIAALARRLRPDLIQFENYHAGLLTSAARPLMPRTRLIGTLRVKHTPKQLFYDRLCQHACYRIVASAPFLRDVLVREAHVPAEKVVVIANAIDVRRFSAPRDAGLRARIAPRSRRVLLSIGRISRQKMMHLIAEAAGRLKRQGRLPADARLFIVGQSQDARMQALLDAAIAQDTLSDQVILPGETDTPEDYYAAVDVTILFSNEEGLPCTVLESLAAGRPVVLSDEANAAGVIEDGVTGWVVRTGDVAQLADTLHHVMTMRDDALLAMRPACVAVARGYSVETLVARYAELYEHWCGSPRPAMATVHSAS